MFVINAHSNLDQQSLCIYVRRRRSSRPCARAAPLVTGDRRQQRLSNVNILKPQYWSDFNSIVRHSVHIEAASRSHSYSLRLHFVITTMKACVLRFIHPTSLTAPLCGNQSYVACNDAKSVPLNDKERSCR